jgi:hypothetical protein
MERRREEDLKVMGIRNWHAAARDVKKWGRTELDGKGHNWTSVPKKKNICSWSLPLSRKYLAESSTM